MASQREQFLSLAAKFEPKIQEALIRAFNSARVGVSEKKLVEALKSGGVGAVMDLLGNFRNLLDTEISTPLEGAIVAGGQLAYSIIPASSFIDDLVRYDPFAAGTIDFIQNYKLNLIQDITNTTTEAIRNSLEKDLIDGVNPVTTARRFKNTIGLTPHQEKAVRNYRKYLTNLEAESLQRKLRDKRFDPTIERAIESGKPLTPEQIDRMVNRYRERYIQYRSRVIARTESLRALSIGNQAAIQQMIQGGEVDQNKVRKFWVTNSGPRTRKAHQQIPGMNPDGRRLDEPFETPLGPIQFPRDPGGTAANTIQCRCTVRYDKPKKETK